MPPVKKSSYDDFLRRHYPHQVKGSKLDDFLSACLYKLPCVLFFILYACKSENTRALIIFQLIDYSKDTLSPPTRLSSVIARCARHSLSLPVWSSVIYSRFAYARDSPLEVRSRSLLARTTAFLTSVFAYTRLR